MNFFEQQAKQRQRSRWLVLSFLMAVLLTALAVDVVLLVAIRLASEPGDTVNDMGVLAVGGIVVVAVILVASLWRSFSLRGGGGSIMRSMGATPVLAGGNGAAQKRLVNVVEEMAIAAGVPVPEIFLLEHEEAINAFAAGFSTADAAVCVTQGCLDRLSRDELQGVIGHEFSHILNGDMRLNLRLMALVFGLVVVAWLGQVILRHSPREKEGAAIALIGGAIWLLGSIGLFFGRAIKASVSRAREYLADASAVQFTRQTHGLVGALRKASEAPGQCKLKEAQGEEVAHMLFGDGIGLSGMLATHPPLNERIRLLDPQGASEASLRAQSAKADAPSARATTSEAMGQSAGQVSGLVLGSAQARKAGRAPSPKVGAAATIASLANGAAPVQAVIPAQASELVGQSQSVHVELAEGLRRGLPVLLRKAAHDRDRAPDVLLALLIDRTPAVRSKQLAGLRQWPRLESIQAMLSIIDQQEEFERLPLAQISFSALKQRPRNELLTLRGVMEELIHADQHVALFEYCLGKLFGQLVTDSLAPQGAGGVGQLRLAAARGPVCVALSLAASLGEPGGARKAYQAAVQQLRLPLPSEPLLLAQWQSALDDALPVLDQLAPEAKAPLIDALSRVMSHDHKVTIPEAEFLRTLCALLHCPLPPLLRAA